MKGLGYEIELTEDAKEFVAEKGYDPQFGARPLHRAIQKYLEDPLAEFILNNNPEDGSAFVAYLSEDSDKIDIKFKETAEQV